MTTIPRSKQTRYAVPEAHRRDEIPAELSCPITLDLMEEPVVAPSGHTYEKKAAIKHLCTSFVKRNYWTDPKTNIPSTNTKLIPNKALLSLITDYKHQQLETGKLSPPLWLRDGTIPPQFRCTLTDKIMTDPVIALDGKSYEREAVETHGRHHGYLIPNYTLKALIETYKQDNMGIQREINGLQQALYSKRADTNKTGLRPELTPGQDIDAAIQAFVDGGSDVTSTLETWARQLRSSPWVPETRYEFKAFMKLMEHFSVHGQDDERFAAQNRTWLKADASTLAWPFTPEKTIHLTRVQAMDGGRREMELCTSDKIAMRKYIFLHTFAAPRKEEKAIAKVHQKMLYVTCLNDPISGEIVASNVEYAKQCKNTDQADTFLQALIDVNRRYDAHRRQAELDAVILEFAEQDNPEVIPVAEAWARNLRVKTWVPEMKAETKAFVKVIRHFSAYGQDDERLAAQQGNWLYADESALAWPFDPQQTNSLENQWAKNRLELCTADKLALRRYIFLHIFAKPCRWLPTENPSQKILMLACYNDAITRIIASDCSKHVKDLDGNDQRKIFIQRLSDAYKSYNTYMAHQY